MFSTWEQFRQFRRFNIVHMLARPSRDALLYKSYRRPLGCHALKSTAGSGSAVDCQHLPSSNTVYTAVMALVHDKVELQPLYSMEHAHDTCAVVIAYQELSYRSVEVISSGRAGVDDFADDCIYTAAILERTSQLVEGSDNSSLTRTVGIIYLQTSSMPGTFDLGLALVPEARGCGLGPEAIRMVVKWAFGELHCHRIQARILQTTAGWRDAAMGAFFKLGFTHEGTSRRALFCPTHPSDPYPTGTNGEWRDVTCLAILDTDWVLHSCKPPSLTSGLKVRWEQLFAREAQDREELLRAEERAEQRRQAKRSSGIQKITTTYIPPELERPLSCESGRQYSFEAADKGKGRESLPPPDAMSYFIEAALSDSNRFFPSPSPPLVASHAGGNNSLPGWHTPRQGDQFQREAESPYTLLADYSAAPSPASSCYHDLSSENEGYCPIPSARSTPSLLDHDPFADPHRIVRSASVISGSSDGLDAEGWDLVETSSSGSSVVWSASDDEMEN